MLIYHGFLDFFSYICIYVNIQCALMQQVMQHVACTFNAKIGNGNLPIYLSSVAC